MTNQEINEAVARKLGFVIKGCPGLPGKEEPGIYVENNAPGAQWKQIPNYSTSIEAAWEIVEQLPMFNLTWLGEFQGTNWRASYRTNVSGEYKHYEAEADTAPLAICKAFLKLTS